ncbi:MAG: hypothetical protein JXQ96_16420 [Cyclobacteriaceae bacterium]
MIIKELVLFTNRLEAEKEFYAEKLGCPLLNESDSIFSVQIGISQLTFKSSSKAHSYHYCFLIPTNQLHSAIGWLEKKLEIIQIKKGRYVQRFDSWNAESVYFYDASGNVAEFIVRHDLKNSQSGEFSASKILSINEIGIPAKNVAQLNTQIENELETKFWKGDLQRFGTNGDQHGLFIIPNYNMKTEWFPTQLKIEPSEFSAIIENDKRSYSLNFQNEKLTISR